MEPLVCFGACLVVYCGYLSIADAVRDWRGARLESPAKRERVKQRGKAPKEGGHSRFFPGITAGRPLMQRAS